METSASAKFFLLQYIETYLLDLGFSQGVSDTITFLIAAAILALLAWALKFIGTKVLTTVIQLAVKRTRTLWDDFLLKRRFFNRLVLLIIGGLLLSTAKIIFAGYPPIVLSTINLLLNVYMVLVSAMLFSSFTASLNDIYNTRPAAKRKSIKSIIQAVNIIVYVVAGILVIAILIRKDPTQLLLGLGASAAIMTLVFKDTILGFVASIQISAQDMIRPGDWIEMPSKGADGVVTEINVSNVKVQNWNNTVTMIPIYSVVSEAFTNWRNMEEGSGRRFKRPLLIDLYSVRELPEAEIARLAAHPWVAPRAKAMLEQSARNNTNPFTTNLGLFRCYLEAYLQAHPRVAKHMPLVVRYLPPGENGISIELYGFSTEKSFSVFEQVVSDIFDHIFAVAPLFGIRFYQRPTGTAAAQDVSGLESSVPGDEIMDSAPAPEPQQ